MKKSTLEKRIAKTHNKDGSIPNNEDYRLAIRVIKGGTARPGHYSGGGRFTTALRYNPERYLCEWKVDYENGNDAEKGGILGEFVKLSKKGERQTLDYRKKLK